MEDVFRKQHFDSHDHHNGTTLTFDYLCTDKSSDIDAVGIIENVKSNELLQLYLKSCKNYYVLSDNIFVHGWIPNNTANWKRGNWRKARWTNGMEAWSKGIRLEGKTIYCGHYNTSWGHAYLHNDGKEFLNVIETMYIDPDTGRLEPHANFDVFKDDGIVCLDGCTALTHKINCEVIDEEI